MLLWTYGQIRTKVQNDLDLQNETNISPDEMVGYCNEAVADAVAEIHKIHEDYFLTSAPLSLVAGQALYSLPANIYANKIRNLVYNAGSVVYVVSRMRGSGDQIFGQYSLTNQYGLQMDYRYLLRNDSSVTGTQVELVPPSRETGSNMKLWFLRQPNIIPLVSAGSQATSDATVIDIPEFYTFIIQFMKVRCLEKDGADPRMAEAATILQHARQMMVDTLSQMIPDDEDTLVPDLSHYGMHE